MIYIYIILFKVYNYKLYVKIKYQVCKKYCYTFYDYYEVKRKELND